MSVHHLLARFSSNDPISRTAVELQARLRRLGHWGRLYAAKAERGMSSLVLPARALAPRPEDQVVVHAPGLERGLAGLAGRQLSVDRLGPPPFGEASLIDAFGKAAFGPAAPKRRVAIVVQRYGEGTGGAEAHARAIAQRMAAHWEVTVLTTCAADHLSWANALPAGESADGPVRVVRFPTERRRRMWWFNRLSRGAFRRAGDPLAEQRWIASQGPLAPGLLEHLAERRGAYDGYVFFTYLYLTTAWGLPLVADRALLVPTAHEEPPFHFEAYRDAFERPRALLCNTPEEEALVRARFPNAARSRVVGVGVEQAAGDGARARAALGLTRPYLFYVGRIDKGKDVPELLRFYGALRRAQREPPDLVLAGARTMRVTGAGVRSLGRIDEAAKFDAIAGAEAVVAPARLESLSLLALEAFSQGTPLLANGRSEVLAGQCRRSGGGVLYTDAASFVAGYRRARAERAALGASGRAFASRHGWADVVRTYREELERLLA